MLALFVISASVFAACNDAEESGASTTSFTWVVSGSKSSSYRKRTSTGSRSFIIRSIKK